MGKRLMWCVIFGIGLALAGCGAQKLCCAKKEMIKINDFDISPDESKIAFSAITPTGNLDIWVVDIDGKNLKKLTFQNQSPVNLIAKFYKRHAWRNFFEIDMRDPGWTDSGRVVFCQQLSRTDAWSLRVISRRYLTVEPDGKDKKPLKDPDKIINKEQSLPVNRFKFSERSEKYKITLILRNGDLLVLKDGEASPQKLIQ